MVLKLGKTFVASDAERVVKILESLAPELELIVDFTDVYEFHDGAFPALFKAVEPLAGRVAFRGLTTHQRRLLQYLHLLR